MVAQPVSARILHSVVAAARCVLLAALGVSTLKLAWVFFMSEFPVDSWRAFFAAVAALPIGIGIHSILSLAYFGVPVFIGCSLYSYVGAYRPRFWHPTRWVPASFAMALIATLTGQAAYGASWGHFSGWDAGNELVSSLSIGVGLSTGAFAILRARIGPV
jgi:hypothetical protein